MRRPVVLSLVFSCAAGCGSTDGPSADEPVARSSSAIQGGTADTTHNFAVGVVQSAKQGIAFCSGVLLAPNLVATARHCVSGITSTQVDCATSVFTTTLPAVDILVTSSPTITHTSQFVGVSSITVPPATGVCGNDIALLILSTNIQLPQYAAPTINPPMTDHQAYTTAVTAIGYGVDTPTDTTGTSAGVRRIRQDIGLACIPNDTGFTDCFSFPNARQFISANEFEGGDGTCEGDSGSGAFDQGSFNGGKWVAFGVLSRGGGSPEGGTCLGSIYTRFDTWAQLIIDAAGRAATMGGYSPPSWTGLPGSVEAGSSAPDSSAASSPSSSATQPGGAAACLASGTICGADTDCCSMSCITYDLATTAYTCACDSGNQCKAGYDCQRGVCLLAPDAGQSASVRAGGCGVVSLGPAGAPPWSAAGGALVTAALALVRRRRRGRDLNNRRLGGDP